MANADPVINISELINLMTGGSGGAPEQINFMKASRIVGAAAPATVAGKLTSLWSYEGSPGAGAGFGSASQRTCTNATNGALKQSQPVTTGKKKRLSGLVCGASQSGALLVYDRLADNSQLAANLTTAQACVLTPTRHTDGVGVMALVEIYAAVGVSAATTIALTYTNDAGVAGKVGAGAVIGLGTGNFEQQRLIPLPIASGDKGIRATASVQCTASTGSSGNIGVTLVYPLLELPMPLAGVSGTWNSMLTVGGPIDLGTDSTACLSFAWRAGAAVVGPDLQGMAYFFEK